MEAGASILAFVVLGIKSTKIIHETLSSIKDGPETVQQLARDALQLHWLLLRLKDSRAAKQDDAIDGHVRDCMDELSRVASELARLQPSPAENSSGIARRKLMMFL